MCFQKLFCQSNATFFTSASQSLELDTSLLPSSFYFNTSHNSRNGTFRRKIITNKEQRSRQYFGNSSVRHLLQQVRRTPNKMITRLLFCWAGFSSSCSLRLLWRLWPLILCSSETMNINKDGHQGNLRISWAFSTLSVAFITSKQLEIWQNLRFTVWMAEMTPGDGKYLRFSFPVSDQRINISGYAKSEVSLK